MMLSLAQIYFMRELGPEAEHFAHQAAGLAEQPATIMTQKGRIHLFEERSSHFHLGLYR